MRLANNWVNYTIIDTCFQEKLEDWNGVKLIRPDPQIIWKTEKDLSLWNTAVGHYHRSATGGGSWDFKRNLIKIHGLFLMVS